MTAWQQLLASGRVRPVDAAFARVLLRQTPQAHPLALVGAALTLLGLAISQRPALRLYGRSRADARK